MGPIRFFVFAWLAFATSLALRQAFVYRKVEMNPRSSSVRIASGLAREQEGDFGGAEQALQEAARVDRQYLPAWTLANFYFRRADQQNFWPWARRAATLSTGDVEPLLMLCDALDQNNVLDRLTASPRLEGAYLDFLIRRDRLDDGQHVALRILARRSPADSSRLVEFADRQIRARNGPAALEIWNGLAEAHLIRFSPIDPMRPLTNGGLGNAPTVQVFDWRLPASSTAVTEWRDSRLAFSFAEADSGAGPLVEQILMLNRNRYRLRFEYVTSGMPSPTGVRWALDSTEGPPLIPSDEWRGAETTLSASNSGLARLRLIYRRDPGTMRADGRIEIRNLSLEVL